MSPSEKPLLESTLTCPGCGESSREMMPTDACQFFWECPSCRQVIRPVEGDCCVFCSFGSVACPPVQIQGCCPGASTSSDIRA